MINRPSRNWWRFIAGRPWLWLVLIAALLPLTWFGGAYLVTGTDINFPLDPVYRLTSRFSLWDQSFITGRDQSVALPTQVFAGIQAFLATLGFGNTLVEQLELVFWLAASGAAAVFFLSQLLADRNEGERRWGMTAGVSVYLFNLFLVNRINEIDVATLGVYVFAPVFIGAILGVTSGRLTWWRSALGTALASVLGIGFFANPPLVFVVGGFLVAFCVLLAFVYPTTRKDLIRYALTFGGAFVALHLWWLIPFVGSLGVLVGGEGGLGDLNLLDWVDGVSRNNTLWNVLRMQGAWDWYETGIGDKPYFPPALLYQGNLLVILLSLTLPLGAVIALRSLRTFPKPTRTIGWFLAATLLVSIVYSMGTNNVVSRAIYDWSASHVPYFWLVRSPWYKFGYLTVIAYTTLFALLAAWVTTAVTRRWLRIAALALLVLAPIAYAFPMLAGRTQLFPYTRLAGVPDYVFKSAEYFNAKEDTHRLVTLPQEEAYNYTWGYGSGGDVLGHLVKRPILSNETFAGGNRQGADLLLESFYRSLYDTISTESVRLLDYLDGNWFVHKNDSKYGDYGESDSPEFIRDRLTKQQGITKETTIGEWDVYRRTDEALGRITTSTDLWSVFGDTQANVAGLPYFLRHLPDPLPQLYVRTPKESAGPGTARNVITLDLPRIENNSLIQRVDFDSPFEGEVTARRLVGSASDTLSLNGRWIRDGGTGELKREGNALQVTDEELPNIIKNPSFNAEVELGFPGPGPWNFSDSSKTAEGDAHFAIKRVPGSDGSPALRLEATNHILALHQDIPDFEPRAIYRLSFDYRHVQGQPPSFATWQATSAVDTPNGQLEASNEWQHHTTFIETDIRSTGLLVYFYAGATYGETTINEYDNIRVEKVGTRTTYAFLSPQADTAPAPAVTFAQQSPTRWTATVQASETPYLLSFLETYHPGWVARANGAPIAADRHVKVNGYANGWYVDAHHEPIEYELVYAPQTRFALYATLSLLTLVGILYLLLRKQSTQSLRTQPRTKVRKSVRMKRGRK